MSVPEPTPEQRAAIESRDRDVFLEAGAGTGKTRVLVERYCEAVCADEVEVDSILAFTFTERAAAELRGRIRRTLMERAQAARAAGDKHRAAELGDHARATERAWVTTIHGFCRRLLAAHPVAAGLDPRFRVLDEAEAGRMRERAFTATLAELMEHGGSDVVRTAAAYRPYRLGDMTLSAHARLRSQGMETPRLPAVADAVRSHEGEGEAEPLSPAELEAAGIARTTLEALLEGFTERYEQLKSDRSGLDFADLELRALSLLAQLAAVREAWRERFAHVLVDEFQDTNRVQLGLIEELRGPDTRLFCVGDEHQSIYRFRNADLQVFRARRAEAQADPGTEVLALRGNFRSRPAPLAAANAAGDVLLDEFPGLTWGRPTPEEGDPAGSVELLLTQDERAKDAAKWKSDEIELEPPPSEGTPSIVAEARFLAQRLREMVDARRGGARRDRRPAAGVHPRRRLRGGARPGGPRPVRGGRARLLVPAAGRGPRAPAGLHLQPARRRAALRRPRLARGTGQPRRPVAAAPGGSLQAARLAPRRMALRRGGARALRAGAGVAGPRSGRGRRAPEALLLDPGAAAGRGAAAGARGADRAGDDGLRLRPRAPLPSRRARAGWRTCAS